MLTPQKAADTAGVSRKTIMDAINAHYLHAIKNNRGHWQIAETDLQAWMDGRETKVTATKPNATTSDVSVQVSVLEERLLSYQKQSKIYLQQLDEAKADKARLMTLLEEAQRKRGLWELLFGRAGG